MEILYALAIFLRLSLATPAPAPAVPASALLGPLRVRRPPAQRTVDLIVQAADRHRVPRAYGLAVCFVESGLQIHHRHALLCGCALHTPSLHSAAAQATCAAVSLHRQRVRCGTYPLAFHAYQTGLCHRDWSDYSGLVRRVARRLRAAGIP